MQVSVLGEHGPWYNPSKASGYRFSVKEKIGKCLALRYLGDFFTCHWVTQSSLMLYQPPVNKVLGFLLGSEWRRLSSEICMLVTVAVNSTGSSIAVLMDLS